jgi:class 3 adenylate cyclase/pimeloyl-ACP methyl ester carboxylesterase
MPFQPPITQYAELDSHFIAYQVFGQGQIDLLIVPGFISHLEHHWDDPDLARFLEKLADFSRVIMFDKLGTGMSDRDTFNRTADQRMDEVRAVMKAAGSERAALLGISEGGPVSMLFAATYPEKTSALVLYGVFAKGAWAEDYPYVLSREQYGRWMAAIPDTWGDPESIANWAPSAVNDEVRKQWWGKLMRLGASPRAVIELVRTFSEIDVRPVLPSIQTPTLILHRKDDRVVRQGSAEYIATRIPGARCVEMEGADHLWFVGDQGLIEAEIEEFLTGVRPAVRGERTLATVLFTDIVGSTALALEMGDRRWRTFLEQHNQLVRRELNKYRGREVRHTGDGFFITFDGPSRALFCAQAIRQAVRELGVEIRAGIHTGEVEWIEGEIGGVAIHLAARVVDQAGAGEILVSGTVKDLVVGSGVRFEDRGQYELRGVPGEWRLYEALFT